MTEFSDLFGLAMGSRASQDKFELYQLLRYVRELDPVNILEIGVHKGFSIEVWRQSFPRAEVVGIETDIEHLEFKEFRLIQGDSATAAVREKAKQFAPYDFLFIDGDHSYEGVKSDWTNYAPMVRQGGIIALHDTQRLGEQWAGNVETAQLFQELRQHFPTIEFHNGTVDDSPGTGLVFV